MSVPHPVLAHISAIIPLVVFSVNVKVAIPSAVMGYLALVNSLFTYIYKCVTTCALKKLFR